MNGKARLDTRLLFLADYLVLKKRGENSLSGSGFCLSATNIAKIQITQM